MSEKVVGSKSFDAILSELAKANAAKQISGFTTRQICEATGKVSSAVNDMIRAAIADGRVEYAGRIYVDSIDGAKRPAPAHHRAG